MSGRNHLTDITLGFEGLNTDLSLLCRRFFLLLVSPVQSKNLRTWMKGLRWGCVGKTGPHQEF